MILNALDQRVDGLQPKAVLTAAVESVGLVNKQHAAQRALYDRIRKRCRMAHIAAHKVCAGDLDQLAAAQRTDGLEVFCQNAGNRGLAGAGVSGEDHVHVDLGHLEALRLAALLGLHIFGNVAHIVLDLVQTDDGIQLRLDCVHIAAVLLGQQRQQVNGRAAVHCHAQAAVLSTQQGWGAVRRRRVGIQHILGDGAVGGLAVVAHCLHAARLAVLGGQQVAHIRPH